MNKESLTRSEAETLKAELQSQDVTIAQVIPNIPEGLYNGKFQSQTVDKVKEPVITCIEYNRDGKAMAFFALKADISNDETAKSYNGVNIALSDELNETLGEPANLSKDWMFRSQKGRVRNFVSVAE